MTSIIHENLVKAAFEKMTGLQDVTVKPIIDGNWFDIQLSKIAAERNFVIRAEEAMNLVSRMLKLESMERKTGMEIEA